MSDDLRFVLCILALVGIGVLAVLGIFAGA